VGARTTPHHPAILLPAFDPDDGTLNAIVDTTKGSRNKFEYDMRLGLFRLGGVLPAGASFPYDFGFVPSTLGGDGDPLDVLVLMDEPAFVGCLVPARLIGVVEAEQSEGGEAARNDRLIAVAANSRSHEDLSELDDVPPNTIHEIEHFFVSYNAAKGKTFTLLGRGGAARAHVLVRAGHERHARANRARGTARRRA
jgi:inorganic pyrophosphatase